MRVWRLDEHGCPIGEPINGVVRYPAVLTYALPLEGEIMHPGTPRDLDLEQWLDGIGFKMANTQRKQLGHEAARQLVADLGRTLHGLLPAGRDKSLAFTALEDVLMRANRALALGEGPRDDLHDWELERLALNGPLEEDPRITAYKAEQRGEESPAEPAVVDDKLAEDGPAETLRRSIEGTEGEEVTLQISGARLASGGYVDVAVIASDPNRALRCYREEGRFQGFHRTLDTPEQVEATVRALLEVSHYAGLAPEGLVSE